MNDVEERVREKARYLNKIKGSLIGGAAGDALGYAVEFWHERSIFQQYGEKGITEYDLVNGTAQISDDTQMTLFTANAVLFAETRGVMRGIGGDPKMYARDAYLDWYTTQTTNYEEGHKRARLAGHGGISWLLDVPELYARRAPGSTCMSALYALKNDKGREPMNDSKGCGGIMRIAPVGLHYHFRSNNISELDKTGAALSAITHGHSLGYMPSAVLTHILNRIVYPINENLSLKDIVIEARDAAAEMYKTDEHIDELTSIIDRAVELSENEKDDLENIKALGEGWVAEETLAIAIYCSLKHQNDFSQGIIAAVNHSGDSDSTGAVTGNILGALLGFDAIEDKWKNNLELYDVIVEMAEDLCYGCNMSEYGEYHDENWVRKYMKIYWKEEEK